VKDDASQLEWRTETAKHLQVTPVPDRTYFHSIYFREPGGVLFELATDAPGFSFDEHLEHSKEKLKLPAWLEPKRKLNCKQRKDDRFDDGSSSRSASTSFWHTAERGFQHDDSSARSRRLGSEYVTSREPFSFCAMRSPK